MARSRGGAPPPKTALAIAASAPAKVPAHIRELLGSAPITHLEDAQDYERRLASVAAALTPKDFVEWLFVRDVVDLTLEADRARRAINVCLALAHRKAVAGILREDNRPTTRQKMTIRFVTPTKLRGPAGEGDGEQKDQADIFGADIGEDEVGGDSEDKDEIAALEVLERRGLPRSAVADVAYQICLPEVERLQRLIDNAIAGRNSILREIERRRDSQAARRLRDAVRSLDKVVDAVFEENPVQS